MVELGIRDRIRPGVRFSPGQEYWLSRLWTLAVGWLRG